MRWTNLGFIVAITLLATSVSAQRRDKQNILDQKSDLQRIQEDLERGKKALDSLKDAELSLEKRISDYDQRITSNKKIISRLGRQISNLRGNINKTEAQLQDNQVNFERTQRRYLGNLRQFYLASRQPARSVTYQPNLESRLKRQATYLRCLSGYELENVDQASRLLAGTVQKLDDLSGERSKVANLKKKKETAASLDRRRREKKEKELASVHRQKSEEADRVMMLSQAAREMEKIIASLTEEPRTSPTRQPDQPMAPSVIASMKGTLKAPAKGKIVVGFGKSIDPVTNLRSYSPGITIKGKAARNVRAVASGKVAYVGELRGYGNFVIVDHGDQYFSTYAGLSQTVATKGQLVQTGSLLAKADTDGLVRFELRQGREPLDPVKWIKLDSF